MERSTLSLRWAIAAAMVLIAACQAEQLVDSPPPETLPPGLTGNAIRLDSDLTQDRIQVVLPAAPGTYPLRSSCPGAG